ncbi:MAG: hypothetical protein AAF961_16670 [Planctomycetota bacterium]
MREPHELSDQTDYVALNPLSIVCLLLGFASPAAFISPLLLVIPAAAFGTSLLAIAQIRASGGGQSGLRLAQCGAALAAFCAVGAVVRSAVSVQLVRRQATAVAQRWVDLVVDDQLEESLKLLTPTVKRQLGPRLEPEQPPPPLEEIRPLIIETLRGDPTVQQLQQMGEPPRLTGLKWAAAPETERGRTRYYGEFAVDGDLRESARLGVNFVRSDAYSSDGAVWRIMSWQMANKSP